MGVRVAREADAAGFIELARQVEHWFGPMAGEPGFQAALAKHIGRGTALVATSADDTDMLGGLFFTAKPPVHHVRWLVVSERARGTGIGRALLADAMRRFVTGDGIVEVVTFGADHPGAAASGARAFYERLGFTPAEPAAPGPDGGSRQVYRKVVTGWLLARAGLARLVAGPSWECDSVPHLVNATATKLGQIRIWPNAPQAGLRLRDAATTGTGSVGHNPHLDD